MRAFFERLLPRSFRSRLRLFVGLTACAVLAVSVWFGYRDSGQALERHVDAQARVRVESATLRVHDFIQRMSELSIAIAARQGTLGNRSEPSTIPYLADLLKRSQADEVDSVWMVFDDPHLPPAQTNQWVNRASMPKAVVPTDDDWRVNVPRNAWYNVPKRTGRLYVTEPFLSDQGGGDVPLVSISVPVHDAKGAFIGVAGTDVSLAGIRDILARMMRGTRRGPGTA